MTSHRSHTSAQPGTGLVTSGLGERFETHRPRLTSIAYRMLGSVGEAEDAVQDAWLRLSRADVSTIRDLEGWLITAVARVSIDHLRSRRARAQEANRLPDPIVVRDDPIDPEAAALLSEALGLAFMVVLDRLTPAERIAFVPPGCDVPVAAGPPLDLRRGGVASVLCVANWAPPKGILELVEAFATQPQPSATLWLVGETDLDRGYAERVRRRISAPDLRDRVVVRGSVPIEEVGRFYRSADVFALCSFSDAYGTAWAEALAAGLPVVGWRAGNLPCLADHGREALMAEPGDVAGLASALRAITTDRSLRDRVAAGARRRALTLPTWSSAADRFFAAVRGFLRS